MAAPRSQLVLAVRTSADVDFRGAAVLVVLEADELHKIWRLTRPRIRAQQPALEVERDRLGERAWIVDREDVLDTAPARARPPFDRVELLGVRCPAAVEPELVVVADRVDDERVAFPVTYRMSPPRRRRALRML